MLLTPKVPYLTLLLQTFYPLEFWGIPLIVFEGQPFGFCGWQGIIPAKAEKMASKAVDLMTTKLLCVQDVFARLDPARVAEITGPILHQLLGEIIEATALEEAPGVWALLPTTVKEDIVAHAMEDAPECVEALMDEIRNNIEEVFDLKEMVINNLMRDKDMLNQVFLRCGKDELNFIKVLGGYLGLILGVGQMLIYIYYKPYDDPELNKAARVWVLPVTGFILGYLTNYLALKMIFEPIEPIDVFGLFTWQVCLVPVYICALPRSSTL